MRMGYLYQTGAWDDGAVPSQSRHLGAAIARPAAEVYA
jgi:hypothetical protein